MMCCARWREADSSTGRRLPGLSTVKFAASMRF
jgi:hypothetical protein